LQTKVAVSSKRPAAQSAQPVRFVKLTLPSAQGWHFATPPVPSNWPSGHSVHSVFAFSSNFPAGHASQLAAPDPENFPPGHAQQPSAPADE
jgi:hypothetical protein